MAIASDFTTTTCKVSQIQRYIFLLFLYVITFADTTVSSISNYQNERDYLALMDFKSRITSDPYGITKSWNASIHFCAWSGVTCGRRHKRVASINLESQGLGGSLSPFLGNLSFIRELHLGNNTFQGKIPPEYGHLFRLQILNLTSNSLEGEIPANLSRCSNLEDLRVGFNHLTGKIPEELGSLSRLKQLSIHHNKLTGGIPHSLGNLTSLLVLSAGKNSLVGEIPESLGQLQNLTAIGFGDNQLSGSIPPSIYNISTLSVLSFPHNQLHGRLSPSLGLTLPHLQILQLRDNYFTGSLPPSFSNASKIQEFDMGNNSFTGKITIDFGGLQNLIRVFMRYNLLGSGEPDEMHFLSSLTNCTNLEILELSRNQLRGALPEDIGNFSSTLHGLGLEFNRIYGSIPSTIGKLIGLSALLLNDNQLTGTIPSSVSNLQGVQLLSLGENKLSGKIPKSLGNLTLVTDLFLSGNQLEGAIPPDLGNCRNLDSLDLSDNQLTNTIPKEIFMISSMSRSLNLSQNHFTGSLPFEIGELVHLTEFDVSENNLSSEIPESIGKCTSLEYLNLADNSFNGSFPSSFSSLRGLQMINVSHNNLSGQIPLFLKDFSLQTLDLSFNNLEGEVPMSGIFANATIVSVDGNIALCGGISELQLPKCPKNKSKKHKISYKIIIPTITIGALLFIGLIWLAYFFFCSSKRRRGLSPASPSMRSHLKVSYGELFKATNGFSSQNLIGVGSFGSVYKGILTGDDGYTIAVKVFNLLRRGASKSFIYECEALREIRHRNLVKIISCCSSIDFQDNDFKALVYEFMPNGSLEHWLHSSLEAEDKANTHRKLDLFDRINIAIDIACALDYLHHHCQTQIVHCDIKPSNILLDSDLTAHVGDFGLAKLLPIHTIVNESNSIGIRGSIGYVAPEYGLGTEVSPHGDVYSYGILLLEMMTGKRPTDSMFVEGLNLRKLVSMAMPDHIIDILDPILLKVDEASTASSNRFSPLEIIKGSKVEECLISICHVGLACSVDLPHDRMDMSDVVLKLISIRNSMIRYQGKK